jgi:hypothetical protein
MSGLSRLLMKFTSLFSMDNFINNYNNKFSDISRVGSDPSEIGAEFAEPRFDRSKNSNKNLFLF